MVVGMVEDILNALPAPEGDWVHRNTALVAQRDALVKAAEVVSDRRALLLQEVAESESVATIAHQVRVRPQTVYGLLKRAAGCVPPRDPVI